MNAIQQIKAILEGAGRRVYYIRDAVFTASWLVQNCDFPAVLLFERRLRQFQHEGVGAWRELCECKMVCVTTTAYEFQTAENDAIQETQTTEALSLCSLLRQSQMFDRFDVGQALAVYDGAIGVLLTGCSIDLTASTLAGECGTPPDAGKIITENGRTDVLGLSWVEVNVQGSATIEPLTVTPTDEEQTITPPQGVDGFAPVTVDAVTAAIDVNIKPENIKKDVEILGVTGTLEQGLDSKAAQKWYCQQIATARTRDPLIQFPSFLEELIDRDGDVVTMSNHSTLRFTADWMHDIILDYCTTIPGGNPPLRAYTSGNFRIRGLSLASATQLLATNAGYGLFAQSGYGVMTNCLKLGTLTNIASANSFGGTPQIYLRKFEVGTDTNCDIPFSMWTATNVISEGQSGIDELNYNIKTYLADRVADRTNDTALTITFGASLYNVLTADTIAAFTAKNWNVASA